MFKDLNIAKNSAEQLNVDLPIIDTVRTKYENIIKKGMG